MNNPLFIIALLITFINLYAINGQYIRGAFYPVRNNSGCITPVESIKDNNITYNSTINGTLN